MSLVLLSSRLTYEQSFRDGGGVDVDIVCSACNCNELKKLISSSTVHQVLKPSSMGRIELLLYRAHTSKYVVLDVQRDYSLYYHGRSYSADALLRLAVSFGTKDCHGLIIPPDEIRVFMILLKCIYLSRDLSHRYGLELNSLSFTRSSLIRFCSSFGLCATVVDALMSWIYEGIEPSVAIKQIIVDSFCRVKNPCDHGLDLVFNLSAYYSFSFYRGILIATSGVDGSGKSTLIDKLKADLPGKVVVSPWASRRSLLPTTKLYMLINRKRTRVDLRIKQDNEILPMPSQANSKVHTKRRVATTLLRNLVKYSEYLAKYFEAQIYMARGCTVIADRWIFDEYVNLNEPAMRLNRLIYRFFYPSPTLSIIFSGNPTIISSRKPSIPVNVARYYSRIYRQIYMSELSRGLTTVAVDYMYDKSTYKHLLDYIHFLSVK